MRLNSPPPISIYPEFFKSGVDKVQRQGMAGTDMLALFTALEHFQRDIKEHDNLADILRVTQLYLAGLSLFRVTAYYMVNPEDFSFEQVLCDPPAQSRQLDELVQAEIAAGRFAWALRQRGPVFFQARAGGEEGRGVFHSLAASTRVVGMRSGWPARN